MSDASEGMRIYVACLASYNAGALHGAWIDVEGKNADDLGEEVAAMLRASPEPGAEEWAIHDFEGFPVRLGEFHGLDEIAELVALIEEADSDGRGDAFRAALEYHGIDEIDYVRRLVDDGYCGHWDTLGEYAESFADDCGWKVPEFAECYVDWQRMGEDWERSGDILAIDDDGGGVHVFHANV